MIETLEQMIERHEGYRDRPYDDATGKTVKQGDTIIGYLTIGIGHNLEKPIPREVLIHLLKLDIADATNDCLRAFPWFVELTEIRKRAMIDLCFNLGLPRLQKFVKFLRAMSLNEYDTAANELIESSWFKQVGRRGPEIAGMIRGSVEV